MLDEIPDGLFTSNTSLFVEMLTDNYHEASIEAIAIVNDHGNYVMEIEKAVQSTVFKAWAEDDTKKKTVFDAKATKVALLHEGIELNGIDFDLMLAAYLVNPAEKNEEIAPIARRTGVSQLQYDEEVYGKGAKRAIPEFPILAEHIARKTYA